MRYDDFIEEFEQIRSQFLDKRFVKDTLEACVDALKDKVEEDGEEKSWFAWFRWECLAILSGKAKEVPEDRPSRRPPSPEFMMGVIFVLNKLFVAWNIKADSDLTKKWEVYLDQILPLISKFLKQDKKKQDHILKIITKWETENMFSKKTIESWKNMKDHPEDTTTASTTTDHSTAVEAVTTKKKRKLEDTTSSETPTSVANTTSESARNKSPKDLTTLQRQDSDDGLFQVTDIRSAAIHTMYRFTHAMCTHYFDNAMSSADKVYWRLFEVTAFFLLHQLTKDYEIGEDEVSLCLASIYLAGKIENMFLKTEKLRGTAEILLNRYFPNREVPSDDEILRYETELLQLIKYDINIIHNPVKFSQEMAAKEDLEKLDLMSIMHTAGNEEFLFQRCFFEFPSATSACVLFMVSQCKDIKVGDQTNMRAKLKKVYGSEMFTAVDDRIQLIAMVSKVRKHSEKLLRDCALFYDQVLDLFHHYTEIEVSAIPPAFLYQNHNNNKV